MQNNIQNLAARDVEIVKCVTKNDWLGALALVSQFTVGATGAALGAARLLEAWVRMSMDTNQAHNAASLLKEALLMLEWAPRLQAQALLVGFYVADVAHDSDLCDKIISRARRLLADTSPAVMPWHGRLLYRLACHWTGAGRNLAKAETALRECIEWHHRNAGPFDEQDRRRHMRLSLVALAEIHLAAGRRNEAGARAKEALRFLDGHAQPHTRLHLQGLVAEADNRESQAINAYEHGIADARAVSDWPAVAKCAAAYGRIMRHRKEWDALREVLRPLVTELIEAGQPAEAHRLQLLAVPSGERVGAPQVNPTSDMLRLLAELVGAASTKEGA